MLVSSLFYPCGSTVLGLRHDEDGDVRFPPQLYSSALGDVVDSDLAVWIALYPSLEGDAIALLDGGYLSRGIEKVVDVLSDVICLQ